MRLEQTAVSRIILNTLQLRFERLNSLDVDGLYHYVTTEEITIGGEVVAAMMMSALAGMGREMTDFSVRGDSFHVKQDPEAVVGYAGVIAWENP